MDTKIKQILISTECLSQFLVPKEDEERVKNAILSNCSMRLILQPDTPTK